MEYRRCGLPQDQWNSLFIIGGVDPGGPAILGVTDMVRVNLIIRAMSGAPIQPTAAAVVGSPGE
jgi:hypothetical protein